jgi:hypothetical protein
MTPPPRSTAPATAADDNERKAKHAAYVRAWRKANAEKVKAQRAAYGAANAEMIKAKGAAYRAAHREELKAKAVAYRAAAKRRPPGA